MEPNLLTAAEYEASLKEGKFEKGKTMTVDEVSKVVGPEFKKMNEDPPESVKKVKEEIAKSAGLTASDYRVALEGKNASKEDESAKEGKFEKGKSVPLKDLPEELQDNVTNPPESVKKLKEELSKKSTLLTATDYQAALSDEAAKEGKFEKGKSVPVKDLPKELQENVTDPPESVQKVKDELSKKATNRSDFEAALKSDEVLLKKLQKDIKTLEDGGEVENLTLEGAKKAVSGLEEAIKNKKTYMSKMASEDKTAASGKYGFTKDIEASCTAGSNRLQKAATKIAKALYARDEQSPSFLQEHAERGSSKSASMLLKAMEGIGPMATINKTAASKSGKGMYGFAEKTAKLGLDACTALHHEAGMIAADVFTRKATQHEKVAGYLGKHAKAGKCAYSAMLLDAAPKLASPAKVATQQKVAFDSSLGAKKVTSLLSAFISVGTDSQPAFLNAKATLDELVALLKLIQKQDEEWVAQFADQLGAMMSLRLKTKLAGMSLVEPSVAEILAWDTKMAADFLASDDESDAISLSETDLETPKAG